MSPARATATRPIWREVAPHREATTCEDFSVRRAHVPLVRAVLSNAGDEGLHRDDIFIVLAIVLKSYNFFGALDSCASTVYSLSNCKD